MDAPRSMREYVNYTLINSVPPIVGYYGLRLFGVPPYLALVGAIATGTAQGVFNMLRKRKFEPVNGLMIVGAACSLAIALVTKNPRLVQALELIPASLFVYSTAISGLVRRPTSKKLTGAMIPSLADGALPGRGWTQQDIREWHGLHTRLCVRLGILCGLFPFVALFWIFTLPVDISQILIVAVGPTLLVVSIAAAVALLRRFIVRSDEAAARRAGQPAAAAPRQSA
ncbi:hypothetical protein H7K15_02345 [Mycobacterium parmense]|nr:hypothetical protein [Mycobacterium parmense]